MLRDRVIGRYSQGIQGPLLVVFGAMHGNEPAGVIALNSLFKMLEDEKIKNPEFRFTGSILGLIGNLEAYEKSKRFINKDLNRSWTFDAYKTLLDIPNNERTSEQVQIYEIIDCIRTEINLSSPAQIIVLDLHTTSAHGGIFSLITDDPISEQMAIELHAPVIKGMLKGIQGSSINFFHGENLGIPTTAIAFESGQHDDPISVFRAIAAVINCMRTIGCVNAYDVENRHDEILINFSKNLPKVNEFIGKYSIKNPSKFAMLSGFKSFDKVTKSQHLADDENGPVYCQEDGMILMPFYQKLGEDGYFLIKAI
jgi:predicted deacylase